MPARKGTPCWDRRLYLPQEWLEDAAYAERREAGGVPADITFKSKPELALAMVETVAAAGSWRYRWLARDEGFGDNPPFLDGVARHAWYLAEVSSTTHVWVERPQIAVPAWSGRGRKPNQPRLSAGQPASQAVAPLIDQIPQE
jgi:SRSO17 transposase